MVAVPMRTDCKFYESRTYRSGETVRKCHLDLAPEAPWRCPENCPAFAPRLVDAGWSYGSVAPPPPPPEPPGLGEAAASLLDEAEEIVNAAGPRLLAEVERERGRRPAGTGKPPFWRRWFRRA